MLIGNKIILEEIDQNNIEWLRMQRNNPKIRKYFREWKDISKQQQERWYNARGNNSDDNHVFFQIMAFCDDSYIFNKNIDISDRKIIGCCGLSYIDWRLKSAELTIYTSFDSRGRGFGKEALTMLFNYGFNEMNLNKIWAEVYEFNKAMDIYINIGMKNDGILRQNCFHDGKYYDSIILSVLKDEWDKIK